MHPELALPLAGMYQAASLVARIAYAQPVDADMFAHCLETIYILDPPDTLSVYQDLEKLKFGLKKIATLTQPTVNPVIRDTRYYLVMMAYLGQKLIKKHKIAAQLQERITNTKHQPGHFGILHPQVVANLSDTYTTCISPLALRIRIQGLRNTLVQQENIHKIRALLLAGVRSAVLWRQLGGHYYYLLLRKGKLAPLSAPYLQMLEKQAHLKQAEICVE